MKYLNFKKQAGESWKYLVESRNYVFFAFLLFLVSTLIGYFFYTKFSFIDEILRSLVSMTQDLNGGELILFILQNNLLTSLFGFILGIVFGIFPFFTAVSNGIVLGYVLRKVAEASGSSQFWRILPHGIFELPAVFISLGLGMKLGVSWFSAKRNNEFRRRFYSSINTFLFIVVPLLIIAAIIEGLLIVLAK